jgi:hypothetical protein
VTRTRCLYAGVVFLAACTDSGTHIYRAQKVDALPLEAGVCLDPMLAFGTLDTGQSSFNCVPECFVVPNEGGSPSLYVSNQCPPYPTFPGLGVATESEDEAGTGDPCVGAFKAFADFADAGPCPTPEAGADAGPDAADASAMDATVDAVTADVVNEHD